MYIFLLPLALLLAASQAALLEDIAKTNKSKNISYRLPNNVRPENYDITLVPTFHDEFTFTGKSTITVKVLIATNIIIMHSFQLEYPDNIIIRFDNKEFVVKPKFEDAKDFLILELEEEIQENTTVQIFLNYAGILWENGLGFSKMSFEYVNRTRYFAYSQFKPDKARFTFPCFDEPALKASFELSIDLKNLKIKEGYKAISGMPLLTPQNGTLWKFKKTPPMSTYMIFFAVFPENYFGLRNFSEFSQKNRTADTNYAFNKGKEILEKMQKYINVPYQLEQMDPISIRDFVVGALERWSLVLGREKFLLYNNKSTALKKQEIVGTIANKFAHQWFGGRVSLAWWNNIWLNEGFATFFQHFISDEVEESFKMRDQFVIRNLQEFAFVHDASNGSRPLNADVENSERIGSNFYELHMYEKTACLIRMMQNFLTETKFKEGLKNYLIKMTDKPATSNDLFKIFNEEWKQESMSLINIMNTWINQPGYPVITVKRNYNSTKAEIVQHRFCSEKQEGSSKEKWAIPINFASQANSVEDFKTTAATHWFESNNAKMEIDLGVDPKDWVIFNIQQTGYYRVNYDEDNWRLIIKYLTSNADNLNKIHYLNRAQLLDDAWNLANAGLLSYEIPLNLTNYLIEELDYFPWVSAINNLANLERHLKYTQYYNDFQKYCLKISSKVLASVGFQETESNDHIEQLKREKIVKWVCHFGHENCFKEYEKQFFSWLENTEKNPIKPNLKYTVLCTGIKNANQTIWNRVYEIYQESQDTNERILILEALGCSKDEKILNRYLDFSTKGKLLKYVHTIVGTVIRNDVGFNIAMRFVIRHVVITEEPGTTYFLTHNIFDIASRITIEENLRKLQHYFSLDESIQKWIVNYSIDVAKKNIDWVENNGRIIGRLLLKV